MALLNVLGGLASSVPGFAGGQIPLPRQYVGGIDPSSLAMSEAPGAQEASGIQDALARNSQMHAAMPQREHKPFAENALGKIMGVIGDALLARAGLQPMYMPQMMQQRKSRRMGSALSNYLGKIDPELAGMISGGDVDPGMALDIYKMTHQQAEPTAEQRNFSYYQGLPEDQRSAYEKYLQLTHPGMVSPVTLGPTDTIELPGAPSTGEVTATGPNGEKIRLNPETNQWEPMGGPTQPASGGFPGQ